MRRTWALTVVGIVAFGLLASAVAPIRPPAQPETGPGGADYKYAKVSVTTARSGGRHYWIFEPDKPWSEALPVVAFLHGAGGSDPKAYEAWIHHLVRRGAIVVFPRFRDWGTASARAEVRRALTQLDGRRHAPADLTRFAVVGHSLGAIVAANLAASPAGLPPVKALMVVEPGDPEKDKDLGERLASLLGSYTTIDPNTLMLVVVGADDDAVGDAVGRQIFADTPQIADDAKDFVVVSSDRRGAPALVADHAAPLAPPPPGRSARRRPGTVDALDYYGFWKLFDGLIAAAFNGGAREAALGGGDAQTSMGAWSDGAPVAPLVVSDLR